MFESGGSATLDIRNGGLGKIEYGYAVWNGTNLQHTAVKGVWKAPRQYSELRNRVTSVTKFTGNARETSTAKILMNLL